MGKLKTAKKIKRKRKHGYRKRMKSKAGQKVLKRKRAKKRRRVGG